MSRKISILAVVLCVALLGVGQTLGAGNGTASGGSSGGSSMEIVSSTDQVDDTSSASPTDEIEQEDEPILTVETELWEVVKSAAAVVGILFGPGSGTTGS